MVMVLREGQRPPGCGKPGHDTDHWEIWKGRMKRKCRECYLAGQRARATGRHTRRRQQILDHYGRECACCGESIEAFLTVDHVNRDGAEHRRQLGNSNARFYASIVADGFPSWYQILCFNCNIGREINHGLCPHEEEQSSTDQKGT